MRDGYGGSYRGSRYRGRRGGGLGKGLLILLLAAALLALALWAGRGVLDKLGERESRPTPTPTAEQTSVPEESDAPVQSNRPEAVKGVYVSGAVAGNAKMDEIIELLDATELNAVVIDVKNDDGQLTYIAQEGMAKDIGACVSFVSDMPALLQKLKEHNIYTIARVVAFKDPLLAKARPDLTLKSRDGSTVKEGGLPWVDPFQSEVRDYLTEIALGAADLGFDEVQFDYVRFSTGKGGDDLLVTPASEGKSRADGICEFLDQVSSALEERGVALSADVFGTVIMNRTDADHLGQNYARMGQAVDVICPMVYPSHYASGVFGLEVPDAQPYGTILNIMDRSKTALGKVPEEERPVVRPWLQAFTATWVPGHIEYGGEQIRDQIRAVYDMGYSEWILWNAQNNYSADGLEPAEE